MAAMTLVESVGAFVEAIEKSGLASPESAARVRDLAKNVEDPLSLARRLVKEGMFTKWQAGQLLYGYHQLVVGKYKLLEQLGAGEVGRVFLAEHVQMGRKHSLKIFSRRYTSQPDVLKKFLAEAQRVSGLEHRNISHVYDVNQDGDRYYLVMEYVEGQNLQTLVEKSGRLAPATALEYLQQTAAGLAHAHEHQVIHGDLKPSNLMLEGSTIKILDLGQARLFESPAAAATDEEPDEGLAASAIFHSPEQRQGQGAVDPRTDIYSLGSTFCFLLSGKLAENSAAAEKHLAEIKDLPAPVKALCTSLMAEKADDRPASMGAVLGEIASVQAALSGAGVVAEPVKAKKDAAKASDTPKPSDTPKAGDAPKAKKPPVAKALSDSSAMPVAKPLEPAAKAAAETTPTAEKPGEKAGLEKANGAKASPPSDSAADDEAFGGFAIKTKGRVGKKPPAKAAAPAAAAKAPAAKAQDAEAEEAVDDAAPAPARSHLPLIIGGSVGGGVLALAGLLTIVYFLFFRGPGQAEVAEANAGAAKAAQTQQAAPVEESEANPLDTAPEESNPLALAADDGADAAAGAPADAAKPPEPAASSAPGSAAAANNAAGNTAAANTAAANTAAAATPTATATPMPAATATPAATEPMPAAAPAPMPMPAAPAVAATESKPAEAPPAPMPAPAAPPANPFVGFAKAVALPKLPAAMGEVPPESLTPVVLGPCKVDDKALMIVRVKGGETAIKGGRQKFDLQAANNGTALRDWEFSLQGSESPVVIARLKAEGGNLSFQWTEEGVKLPNAGLLSNCAVELNAGAGRHIVSLRLPEVAPPVVLDFEKASSNVKWVIENPPDPKQVYVQVTAVEGVPRKKFDPQDTIEGSGEDIIVWTGPADDTMVVGMRLSARVGARNIDLATSPQTKFEGDKRPERLNKRELTAKKTFANQALASLTQQVKAVTGKDAGAEQQRSLMNQQIEQLTKGGAQVDAVLEFLEAVKGQVKIQCRVYHLAEDAQVDLLVTSNDAPVEK